MAHARGGQLSGLNSNQRASYYVSEVARRWREERLPRLQCPACLTIHPSIHPVIVVVGGGVVSFVCVVLVFVAAVVCLFLLLFAFVVKNNFGGGVVV